MANTFLDQYTLANDEDFQARVTIAALKAAVAVMAEDNPTSGRTELAGRILRNPTGMAQVIALSVVTNAAITEDSDDASIEWTIGSVFNALAVSTATAGRTRTVAMQDG